MFWGYHYYLGWGGRVFFSFGRGGGLNVGMLVVVIPRRKRNYFILHFHSSNKYTTVE